MTSGRPEIRVGVSMGTTRPEPRAAVPAAADDPFRILVLGDFSGRASRGVNESAELGRRQHRSIDRDDFDDVMAALAPTLHLPLAASGATLEVAFTELDDFEPDALYHRVELFGQLRQLRERLLAPATAVAAIAEMTGATAAAEQAAPPKPQPQADAAPSEEPASLLESALQATESSPPANDAAEPRSELVDQLIREYVLPHAVPRQDPRVDDLVADVDRAAAEQMRALLQAPAFRQLEANWRSLYLLVRRLETGRRLQLHLLDVSRDELRADFASGADPLRSGLAKILIDRAGETQGGVPFGVVVSDLCFAAEAADVELAGHLALICDRAGSPFLGAAASTWIGCESFAVGADQDDWNTAVEAEVLAAWQELRQRPEAAALGLVMPRYLLRRPYGARSAPVRSFAFEEEREAQVHDELPWSSAAPLVALLLAQSWQQQGWAMQGLAADEVAGIATHVRYEAGQSEAVPCAEIELSSRGAERMGQLGFMPLFSVRGTDAVRLGALRSVAGAALAGRWGTR